MIKVIFSWINNKVAYTEKMFYAAQWTYQFWIITKENIEDKRIHAQCAGVIFNPDQKFRS